ncbi:MAG: Gfo/Idh/MocA family oxidoreductase, partial [Alicyclobacillus sp.]|nr:Gfo/Idh/MocA family oxidoreductase [Alicyclobacillus sp.]
MLKVAVIGAGTMGTVHSDAYVRMADAELVGIVDVRAEAGEKLARARGTQAYTSLEALLDAVDPDVIDVCVPTYFHRTYVEQIASLGKHVICEKPIARTLEDARAMIEACRQAGVQLYIAQVVRFFPEYRRARDLVVSGALGNIGTARTARVGSFPHATENWYANLGRSGGVLVDLVVHDFDFLRWCFGDVARVYAKTQAGRDLAESDHAFVSLRFQNGVIAHVEGSWAYPSGFWTEFEIAGQHGLIRHQSDTSRPLWSSFRARGTESSGVAVPESPLAVGQYQLELEHFIACIQGQAEPIVTAEDGYKALEIALAAQTS